MGLYNKYILPRVIDWACQKNPNQRQRQKIVPLAKGHVLEIGIGSGLNLPFYNGSNVEHLIGIDPSIEIWNKNTSDTENLGYEFEFHQTGAEILPFENNSFDTVLITYTLCTIPSFEMALAEVRRVLKSSGEFLFCEHGKAPDKSVEKWQNLVNPFWNKIGGGCNLNRDIPAIITGNGLKITKLETMYIPGWKPASFNYWGSAKIN